MAASSTKLGGYIIPGGNGKRVNYGTLTFDSDATVEIDTDLSEIVGVSFGATGSGGNANTLSIDETVANNKISVSGGTVTIDATANNSDTWFWQLVGY